MTPKQKRQDEESIEYVERTRFSDASPSVISDHRLYRRRFLGIAQIVLLSILLAWHWINFAPVSSQAASFFKTSQTAVNWLSTAFLLAYPVATPFASWSLSRRGCKFTISVCSGLILAGSWIKYGGMRSESFAVVMTGQTITGMAQPFVLAVPTTFADLWFNSQGRIGATTVLTLSNSFGAALGQLTTPFWSTSPSNLPQMVLYLGIMSSVACLPTIIMPDRPQLPPEPRIAVDSTSQASATDSYLEGLRALLSSLEFYLVFVPFATYVGAFSALSSLLNQIMEPYDFSESEAGIAGALLIAAGLVSAAVITPLADRYKFYLNYIRVAVPIVASMYLLFYWAGPSREIGFIYAVCVALGGTAFALVPMTLEFLVEILHPLHPALDTSICWCGGQLFGAMFLITMDALKKSKDANPPENMQKALLFQGIFSMAILPLPLCLGLFGRKDKVRLRRLEAEQESRDACSAKPENRHGYSA